MLFIFEIYDKRIRDWYIDFITEYEDIAERYFETLVKEYGKECVRVVTQLKV